MKVKNKTEIYLLAEINQAWLHYRHLEETRTKYLSFFATVILTSTGFFISLLKDVKNFLPIQFIVLTSIFCFLLFVFSYFIWANITRIGFILSTYESIMVETRKYMLGINSTGYHLWSIRERIPPTVSCGIFRIQSAASAIVLGVCVLLLHSEIYMGYLILSDTIIAPKWLGYLIDTLAIFILAFIIHGIVSFKKAQKYKCSIPEISNFSLYDVEIEI
jgi:hypothetical protein